MFSWSSGWVRSGAVRSKTGGHSWACLLADAGAQLSRSGFWPFREAAAGSRGEFTFLLPCGEPRPAARHTSLLSCVFGDPPTLSVLAEALGTGGVYVGERRLFVTASDVKHVEARGRQRLCPEAAASCGGRGEQRGRGSRTEERGSGDPCSPHWRFTDPTLPGKIAADFFL